MTAACFADFSARVNLALVVDHSGRAGCGFLLSLFDQHPEVVSCPWMHYVYSYATHLFDGQDEIPAREALRVWPRQQYFALIYADPNPQREALIRKMGSDPAAHIDRPAVRRAFHAALRGKKTITRRELILATYFAYLAGLGRDPARARYILLSDAISLRTESVFGGYSGKILDLARADFPEAVFIHLVRDPRAGFASTNHQFINQLGNMYGVHWGNALSRLRRCLRFDFDWDSIFVFGFWLMYFRQTHAAVTRKRAQYARQFMMVKNEDLNLDFLRTMRQISARLEISWLDDWDAGQDFAPTMLGMPWLGMGAYNSAYSPQSRLENDSPDQARRSAGPNRHVTERWKSRLAPREILLIETFLWPEFGMYGYQTRHDARPGLRQWLGALLLPLRGELPAPRWVLAGWKQGFRIFLDRVFFSAVWPVYYLLARYAFLRVVFSTRVFGDDDGTREKNSAQ